MAPDATSREAQRVDLTQFVRDLNARHRTDFALARLFEAGESVTARLVDPRGRKFVLKRADSRRAAETTRLLGTFGYPVPRYVIVEASYSVQVELAGRPLAAKRNLPRQLLRRLIELNEFQDERALWAAPDWPAPVTVPVLSGGLPHIDLGLVQAHSEAARKLLGWCQAAVETSAHLLPPPRDITHWDLAPTNILVEGEAVSGVIDWDNTRSGDRLFDLATLLFYSGAPPLRRYLVNRIGREGLLVYFAHVCVRRLGWAVGAHSPGQAARLVRHAWLALEAVGLGVRGAARHSPPSARAASLS